MKKTIIFVILGMLALAGCSAKTTYPSIQPSAWSSCSGGYIALTFDDGPNVNTPQTIAALNKYDIKATFFDIGEKVAALPQFARAQYNAGNMVEDHTWDHQSLTGASTDSAPMTDAQVTTELQRTMSVMTTAGIPSPVLYRPPYGATDNQVRTDAGAFGLLEVGWTIDTNDWQILSSDTIAKTALTANDGGVVLMHDGLPNTIESIPAIASGMEAKNMCPGKIGYSPVAQTVWNGWTFQAKAMKW